jgi:GNAT superfamily N-acetyltransferase
MNRQWIIREALAEDATGLQNCMQSAYAVYRERMGAERLPPLDLDYSSEIDNFPTWVVECKNRIVGGVTMVFKDDHALLANIAIHPDFQGLGIGGELMKFSEEKAKENNHTMLRLATHVLLNENISLYLHLGWKEFKRDDKRVYMKKEL